MNALRSFLYAFAQLLGDANAVAKGKIGQRIARRLAGKMTGRIFARWFR